MRRSQDRIAKILGLDENGQRRMPSASKSTTISQLVEQKRSTNAPSPMRMRGGGSPLRCDNVSISEATRAAGDS